MRIKLLLPLFAIIMTLDTRAAEVDTVSIYSNAMHKEFKCVVIRPTLMQDEKTALPVVYLLHGYSGNFSNWVKIVPQVKNYADEYKLMIVCPDGGYNSWYFDSPVDTASKYETFIGTEVPAWIDAHYPTIKDRKARAITGLSMGGHGGLFLGFRHADIFGACGSMSGGMDLRPFPKSWELKQRLGDTLNYADNWKNYSVINVIDKKTPEPLTIIFDCGTEDFFYTTNQALHEKMLQLNIPHEYIERPGKHDWAYWGNSVQYQLLFFHNYFSRSNKN